MYNRLVNNPTWYLHYETCHPSDNLGAALAACEYAHKNGNEFLAALALAYQVQCRLPDVAPVRAKGSDHTTQSANAIAISGTANNALHVTCTGSLSHWKGLAYPNTAFGAGGASAAEKLTSEGTRDYDTGSYEAGRCQQIEQ
jgi:2-methylcitrate dehydratase